MVGIERAVMSIGQLDMRERMKWATTFGSGKGQRVTPPLSGLHVFLEQE